MKRSTNLTLCETKKTLSRWYTLAILAILLVTNVVFCYLSVTERCEFLSWRKDKESLAKIIDMYQNDRELYEREYKKINDYTTSYGSQSVYSGGKTEDRSLFGYLDGFFKADEAYHQKLELVIRQSSHIRQLLRDSENDADTYNFRFQGEILRRYIPLNENVTLDFHPVYGWNEYYNYTGELLLVVAAILLCCALSATNDYTGSFRSIGKTFVKGGWNTAAAKFLSVSLTSVIITVIFSLSSFVTTAAVWSFSDPTVPVQMIEALQMCPYDISILGFFLMTLGFKILASLFLAAFVFGVTVIFRRFTFGVVFTMLFIAGNYYMTTLDITVIEHAKYANFWSAYNIVDIFSRYRAVNMFGYPISVTAILLFAFAVGIVLSFATILLRFTVLEGNTQKSTSFIASAANLIKKLLSKLPGFRIKGILAFEYYKRLWVLPALVLLFVISFNLSDSHYVVENHTTERNYRKYLEEIGGEYSPEKHQKIIEDNSEINRIIAKYESIQEAYFAKEITFDEFQVYLDEYSIAQGKKTVMQEFMQKANDLKRFYDKGVVGSFVNEHDFGKFAFRGTNFLFIACIWMAGISAFAMERKKTSSSFPPMFLLNTMEKGRTDTYLSKLAVSLTYALIASSTFKATELYMYYNRFEAVPGDTLLISIGAFRNAPADAKVGSHIAVMTLGFFVGALVLTVLCFTVSYFVKDTLSSLIISAVAVFSPGLLEKAGVKAFKNFDINKLIDTENLYLLVQDTSPDMLHMSIVLIFAVAVVICTTLIAFSLYKTNKGT